MRLSLSSLILIIILFLGVTTTYEAKALNSKLVSSETKAFFQSNLNANNTIIAKIVLKNGSEYNFTTIDEAYKTLLYWLMEEKISLDSLENVYMYDIWQYKKIVENKTNVSFTMVPGYKLFFVKKSKSLELNYSGEIIPVNESGALFFGGIITKSLLYGRIGLPSLITVDNKTYDSSYFSEKNFTLMIFYNSSLSEASIEQLIEINKTLYNFEKLGVSVIAVDINNNITLTMDILSKNNLSLIFALERNVTFSEIINETSIFSALGFKKVIPCSILIDNNGLLIRKVIGYENPNTTLKVLETMLSNYPISLAVYPIMKIYLKKNLEGIYTDLVIVLGEGFGSIINATIHYRYIFVNGTESNLKNITIKDIKSNVIRRTIYLPNDTETLYVEAILYSEFGEATLTVNISIEQTEKPSGPTPIPTTLIISLTILVIILALGITTYRKIGRG